MTATRAMASHLVAVFAIAQMLGLAVDTDALSCSIVGTGQKLSVVVFDYALVATDASVIINNSSKCEFTR